MPTMRKLLAVVAAMVAVLVLGTGCEPAMTITGDTDQSPACGQDGVFQGTVTPKTATGKVVLQRTSGGKWVDWTWYPEAAYPYKKELSSPPLGPSGTYQVNYLVPNSEATIHLRVRSAGGSAYSPGVYVTPRCI